MLSFYKMLVTPFVAAEVSSGLWLITDFSNLFAVEVNIIVVAVMTKWQEKESPIPVILLRLASKTLYGRDKNTVSPS